jgi:hypothetical protein
MQGTVVMLMALSGLGCHNKCYDVAYASPTYGCFGGGCYANVYPSYVAPSSFTGGYSGGYSGCYGGCYGGGCYGGCYGGGCYGGGYSGHHGCGLLARLFGCCKSRHSSYAYNGFGGGYGYDGMYDQPVFGYALQYNYGAPVVGEPSPSSVPSEAAPPVPPNPAPSEPVATPPAPTPATPTPDTSTPSVVPTPPDPAEIKVPTPPKPSA